MAANLQHTSYKSYGTSLYNNALVSKRSGDYSRSVNEFLRAASHLEEEISQPDLSLGQRRGLQERLYSCYQSLLVESILTPSNPLLVSILERENSLDILDSGVEYYGRKTVELAQQLEEYSRHKAIKR